MAAKLGAGSDEALRDCGQDMGYVFNNANHGKQAKKAKDGACMPHTCAVKRHRAVTTSSEPQYCNAVQYDRFARVFYSISCDLAA